MYWHLWWPLKKDLKISTRFSPFGDYLPFKKCFVHFIFNDLESSLHKDDPVDQEKFTGRRAYGRTTDNSHLNIRFRLAKKGRLIAYARQLNKVSEIDKWGIREGINRI